MRGLASAFAPAVAASALVLLSTHAGAQPAPVGPAVRPAVPGAQPVAPVVPGAPGTPGAIQGVPGAQPGTPGTPGALGTPPTITVNDPYLSPVTGPTRTLGGWQQALQMVGASTVDVAIARLEVERAEGLRRQAIAGALPSINATGTVAYQIYPGLTDRQIQFGQKNPSVVGQITAQQPLLAPRAWYGIGTANLNVEAAKLSYEDRRRTMLGTVADAIVGVYTSERVAEINRVQLRASLERQNLTQRKFKLGDGTRLDVLRAEQDAAVARSTLIAGDEALRKSREALGLSLGMNEAYGVPPSIALADIEQSVRSVCSPAKPEQRADVRAARNSVEVARRNVVDAWLAFAPTAVLSTTASVSNQQNFSTGAFASWNVQAVLSVPLWEGGARYGQLRIARAEVEQAKLRLDQALRGASLESVQAVRAVTVADQARQVAEQNRDLAREAARLAQRSYEAGTGTSFELIDTAQRARQAELDLTVKEFDVIRAKIAALLANANCKY